MAGAFPELLVVRGGYRSSVAGIPIAGFGDSRLACLDRWSVEDFGPIAGTAFGDLRGAGYPDGWSVEVLARGDGALGVHRYITPPYRA